LYEFNIGIYFCEGDPDTLENEVKSESFCLDEFVNEEGSKFSYEYDFGDGWYLVCY